MKILVTGATGTVGREIVKQLAEGGHHVRALSRNPGSAKFPDGVEAVAGDLAAPESIAAAAGREIQLVELTEQQAREPWAAAGFSPEAIEFFVEIYGNTSKIGYTVVPTVARVTGRRARTFARWAREHAAAFAGSPGRRSRQGARVSVT